MSYERTSACVLRTWHEPNIRAVWPRRPAAVRVIRSRSLPIAVIDCDVNIERWCCSSFLGTKHMLPTIQTDRRHLVVPWSNRRLDGLRHASWPPPLEPPVGSAHRLPTLQPFGMRAASRCERESTHNSARSHASLDFGSTQPLVERLCGVRVMNARRGPAPRCLRACELSVSHDPPQLGSSLMLSA